MSATPATTPETTPDDSSERFSMLEMDSPALPVPGLPQWAVTAVAMIAAISPAAPDAAFETLRAIVLSHRARPECPGKAAVRAAKDTKLAEIEAARVRAGFLPMLAALWVCLWRSLAEGLFQRAAERGGYDGLIPAIVRPVAAPALVAAPTGFADAPGLTFAEATEAPAMVTPTAPSVRNGTWAMIKAGPSKGSWGARVPGHVTAGQIITVFRANGGNPTRKLVTGVVFAANATNGMSVVTITDEPPVTPITGATHNAALGFTARQLIPVVAAESAQEPVASRAADGSAESLGRELADISTEAASNAAGTGAGSMAGGQLAGAGFTSAAGYVTALRNGVKRATADLYVSTLRNSYSYTAEQIAALTVTIIVENDLPVGPGIKHTFDGPGVWDMTRSARKAALAVGNKGAQVKSGTALLRSGDLIAGSIAGGAGGQFSWAGKGKVTRAKLLTALAEIGRESDAPAAKNARAQAGRAVAALRSLGYHIHTVQGAERRTMPNHVAHRYIVGRALTTDATNTGTGAAYGERVLIVDLHRDDTLHTTGDANLSAKVRAEFETLTADDVYISADLTSWLQRTLINKHNASQFGVNWYVPHGDTAEAERLTRAVASFWGESWCHGMPVAACSHLYEGLTDGLSDEVAKHEAGWLAAKEGAAEDRKLGVGTRRAATLLAQLTDTAERVRGYALLIGDDTLKPIRDRIAALDAEIRPATDDTSARASMLEFT